MESLNNNNNNQSLFLSEFKELRKELSAVKKRIVQLEESHEKQQGRIDMLEKENQTLKTQLNIDDDNKPVGSVLKRKRTEKDDREEVESKSASASSDKKKAKTKNNYDEEAVVLPKYDNGDSFDSLSDDLLHKIVEFDGNCYAKFGSINKRCRNIYDVKEYKLTKQTCVFGYGTVEMMLQLYLRRRREVSDLFCVRWFIADAVAIYNRLDAVDWIIQLEDSQLLQRVFHSAVCFGRINILSKIFLNSNLTTLDRLLNVGTSCLYAAMYGQLETLKLLLKYGAEWNAKIIDIASSRGYNEIVQYLENEGCPEDQDESSLGSDVEDDDN